LSTAVRPSPAKPLALATLLLALAAGCGGGSRDVPCTGDGDCRLGEGGVCLPDPGSSRSYCAYSDDACPSALRWSDFEVPASISGQCVPEDSLIDGGLVDAPPPDASSCDAPLTNCGGACVDLATSEDHCGACGWNVVGGRTCIDGVPTPAWEMISTVGAPTNSYRLAFWTGRRFLVAVSQNEVYQFDPDANAWSAHDDLPFDVASRSFARLTLPERDAVFVWAADSAAGGQEPWLFQEGVAPAWTRLPLSGAPSARRYVALAEEDGRVYVMFGESNGNPLHDGASYDLDTSQWTAIPADPAACGGVGRKAAPIAVVDGVLMSAGGFSGTNGGCAGTPRLLDTTWRDASPALPARAMHRLLEVNHLMVMFGGLPAAGESALALDEGAVTTPAGAVVAGPLSSDADAFASLLSYAVRMGRSVFHFSGATRYYNGSVVEGATLGLPSATGITWLPVTATGRPAGRAAVATDSYGSGDQQETWTGRVAIILGGYRFSGPNTYIDQYVSDGATFQPPAGCVCPSESPECAGVSNVLTACEAP
jgi:hypothetical protein